MFITYTEYDNASFDEQFAIEQDSFFIDVEEYTSGKELLAEIKTLFAETTNYCSASDSRLLVRRSNRTRYYFTDGTHRTPCSQKVAMDYLEQEYIQGEAPIAAMLLL